MTKCIVYLAGPMTGIPDYNRNAFFAAEKQLQDMGYTVLNPAYTPDGLEYDDYLSIGFAMLDCSDAIVLLRGWERSEGAALELQRAKSMQKPACEFNTIMNGGSIK